MKLEIWTPPPIQHHHEGLCECKRTIAYIRVSRVGNRQVLISPDIQLDAIYADCRQRGKRVVKIVPDIDKSGRTFLKRSVVRVIEDIKRGEAESVTVWKWSRWGRNLEFSLAYLGQVQAVGGRVDSATDDIDQSTATGRFSRDLIMRVDQLNSDLIGEGWQSVHALRREAGLPHSGRKRFGYDYIDQPMIKVGKAHEGYGGCEKCRAFVAHFVPSATEGPELKSLYERYNAGVGLKKLARDLNTAGFRTPMEGLWTPQAVGQMLDTGFAAGYVRERSPDLLAKMKAAGKPVRNTLKTFDVWRPGSHPTLISEEVWRDYKARRSAQADLPPRLREAVHALSGLMFCELCSRRLRTKYRGAKRQHSWVCGCRETFHPDVSVSLGNDLALAIVRKWTEANSKPPVGPDVDEIARRALMDGDKAIRTAAQVQADIDAELKAHDKLILMNARGKVSDEAFEIAKMEMEQTLRRLREEMAAVDEAMAPAGKPCYAAFESLAATWDETVAADPGLLNEPLRRVLAFVIVSPAGGRMGRGHDASDRVEVVGHWAASSKDRWLAARRRRFAA